MLARTRLARDIKEFYKTDYSAEGIYIHINEEDSTDIKAMIVGGENTPYEFGYHFFSIKVTSGYPLDPPKVNYETGDGRTRFNPNLYTCGKVCLSILGTWSGPPWSAVFTFATVLLSIKSMILTGEPLRNEPGYENADKPMVEKYNDFIEHQNINVAILQQLESIPPKFECFREIMVDLFKQNKEKIKSKLVDLQNKKNKVNIQISYSNCQLVTDYDSLLERFNRLCEKLEV